MSLKHIASYRYLFSTYHQLGIEILKAHPHYHRHVNWRYRLTCHTTFVDGTLTSIDILAVSSKNVDDKLQWRLMSIDINGVHISMYFWSEFTDFWPNSNEKNFLDRKNYSTKEIESAKNFWGSNWYKKYDFAENERMWLSFNFGLYGMWFNLLFNFCTSTGLKNTIVAADAVKITSASNIFSRHWSIFRIQVILSNDLSFPLWTRCRSTFLSIDISFIVWMCLDLRFWFLANFSVLQCFILVSITYTILATMVLKVWIWNLWLFIVNYFLHATDWEWISWLWILFFLEFLKPSNVVPYVVSLIPF